MEAFISEIFCSLQMEGSFIGYPAAFIRFAGCNLNCDFCDTKYALVPKNTKRDDEIYKIISEFNTDRVIFTGGEPALYDDFMSYFIDKYGNYIYFLETNGTIFIKKSIKKFKHIVVSPKFFSINEEALNRYKRLSNSVEFKFVINDESEIEKVQILSDKLDLYPLTLQPLFDNAQPVEKYVKKTKMLIEAFKNSNLARKEARLIMQNHKVIYGKQRGV